MAEENPPYVGAYDKKTGLNFTVDGKEKHADNKDLKLVGRISAYNKNGELKSLEQLEREALDRGAVIIAGVQDPDEERVIKLKPSDRNAYWLFNLSADYDLRKGRSVDE